MDKLNIETLKIIVENKRIYGTDEEFVFYKKMLEELVEKEFLKHNN